MSKFNPSEWLGQGKTYKDVPPKVQKAASLALLIPENVRHDLIPQGSLRDLCTVSMPSIQAKTPLSDSIIPHFFSIHTPDPFSTHMLSQLRYLAMPAPSAAHRIYEHARQAWLDGMCSVRYAHLAPDGSATVTHFPLFVATLWKEFAEISVARSRWQKSSEYVLKHMHQPKNPEHERAAIQTWAYMKEIRWDESVGILQDDLPVHQLYRMVGEGWWSTSMVNMQLMLLAERVRDRFDLPNMRVENCEFGNVLINQYKVRATQEYSHTWLRGVGDTIANDEGTLVTEVNLGKVNGNPHWVSLVVNGKNRRAYYGDSLCENLPPVLRQCVDWWMEQHGVALQPAALQPSTMSPLSWTNLPITEQLDSNNCGLIAIDALQRYVDPGRSLVSNSPRALAHRRFLLFNEIMERVLGRIALEGYESNTEETGIFDGEDGLFDESYLDTQIGSAPSSEFTFSFPLPNGINVEQSSPEKDSPVRTAKRSYQDVDTPDENPSPVKKRLPVVPDVRVALAPLPFSATPSPSRLDLPPASSPLTSSPLRPSLPPSSPSPWVDDDSFFDDMPRLSDVDNSDNEEDSDEEAGDESGAEDNSDEDHRFYEDEGAVGSTRIPAPLSAMPPSHGAFKFSLTDLWPKVSKETWRVDVKHANEQRREEREKRLADKRVLQQKKVERERRMANERQQKVRDKKRKAKIENGWEPKPGNHKKQKVAVLKEYDIDSDDDFDRNPAESSRPHREFRESRRQSKKVSGRKRQHDKKDAIRMNWAQPALFRQIDNAAKKTGRPWSPLAIVQQLKRENIKDFARLTPQVVGSWICPIAKGQGESKWKTAVVERVKRGNRPGGQNTRAGVLSAYPELCTAIQTRLQSMRTAGVPLTVISVRAIMIGYIQNLAPQLFEIKQSDGSMFRCSETFVKKFLSRHLSWSYRRATKTAKKVPENVDEILREAYLREAFLIRNYAIPDALRVNTDQTQIVYQQGCNTTWSERGAKQVSTSGHEEKRAFTLVPSISASGVLLPMQAIYKGQKEGSLPSPKTSSAYPEAQDLKFRLKPSKTNTYWSTQETMRDLVENTIAPYFEATKTQLGLPSTQFAIWKIDCWSVHKSKEFMDYMRKNHPRIIVLFVPACCTSLWQPLDVGMQRIMKLSIKRACHRDMVDEIAAQLDVDIASDMKLDTSLGTLRDRSLGWLVAAFHDCNDATIIKKAFELCKVGELNCSQASLTSAATLELLADLPETDPILFMKLSKSRLTNLEELGEEEAFDDETPDDDSDIPLDVVADVVESAGGSDLDSTFSIAEDGSVIRVGVAETDDEDIVRTEKGDEVEPEAVLELPTVSRSGRTIRPSCWYAGAEWRRS